jgi:cell division protein FtsZ
MTINLHLPTKSEVLRPTITVVGVGGAGGNAVNNMIAANLEGVNFVVANTDAQALDHSLTDRTIQLGAGITKGLGAGAKPEVGRAAAEEAREEISAHIEGSNMVFITAGMGGGTGTGAAAVVARIAKEQGVLTVGVVTKPFQFEGSHRMKLAEAGLKELQDYVDTLIVIPNQNLFRIANERTTFSDAFKMADEVLHSGVRGVTDLMVKPGLINLDFADIRTVMQEMGKAMMGTGEATGDRRAVEAAEAAISNPLLDDVSLKGARALLINITGGSDMTLFEVDEAANRIREEVDPDANIIFGSTFADDMQGRMRVSVVATGIDAQSNTQHALQKQNIFNEPKRPYSFGSSLKVEPVKPAQPVVRSAGFEAPQRDMPKPMQLPAETRLSAPARSERQEELVAVQEPARSEALPERAPEQVNIPQRLSEFREQEPVSPTPAGATPDLFAPQSVAPVSYAPRRDLPPRVEPREDPSQPNTRGFLQRALDVGRAFSNKQPELGERVQVVQRGSVAEAAQRKPQPSEEEQYLDIPAFLRRQAN